MYTLKMTADEIFREMQRDSETKEALLVHKYKEHSKAALKRNRWPYVSYINVDVSESHNRYLVQFFFKDKHFTKKHEYMAVSMMALVQEYRGLYMFCLEHNRNNGQFMISSYSPHVFKRYAERFGIDKTGVELIREFVTRNQAWYFHNTKSPVSYDGSKYHTVSVMPDGILLGTTDNNGRLYVNTFVTRDMLRQDQLDLIEDMREESKQFSSLTYGSDQDPFTPSER